MSKPKLHLVTLWMMDVRGEGKVLPGGLERWCRDLAVLAVRKGCEVVVWQKAEREFEHRLPEGALVRGVQASLQIQGNWTVAKRLRSALAPEDAVVFVSQEMAAANRHPRAVGVNHGIWWNSDKPFWKRWLIKRLQRKTLDRLQALICVDSNYINWCHAELPGRRDWEAKLRYVPNYADLALFPALPKRPPGGPTILLFPRRIPGTELERHARGIGLMLRAFDLLRKRGRDFRLRVAGRGELQGQVEAWAREHGHADRIELLEAALDEMPALYQQADLVVVPSMAHEGTSFSAIEGLVSGKPVVVTHIGGLPNVVLPGLTGAVADLSAESLADAVDRALASPPLERPGVLDAVRSALGKERWEAQVWSCLVRELGLPS